jgi:hypothetical protein
MLHIILFPAKINYLFFIGKVLRDFQTQRLDDGLTYNYFVRCVRLLKLQAYLGKKAILSDACHLCVGANIRL